MLSCCCSGLLKEPDFLRPALFGRLSGRAAALAGHRRRPRAARSAADADPGPHRRRGRSSGRRQRPGERVSQGGVDAAGVSVAAAAPRPPAVSGGNGITCRSRCPRMQPVSVATLEMRTGDDYSKRYCGQRSVERRTRAMEMVGNKKKPVDRTPICDPALSAADRSGLGPRPRPPSILAGSAQSP